MQPRAPRFSVALDPAEGIPDYIVVTVELEGVVTAASVTLDVGEKHMLLTENTEKYFLNIPFSHPIDIAEVGAQFHRYDLDSFIHLTLLLCAFM